MPQRKTVRLADGYNGHTVLYFTDPIETDGELVKLQVAEPGRGFMSAWKRRADVIVAIKKRLHSNRLRRERTQAYLDCGLVRRKDSMGRTIWE